MTCLLCGSTDNRRIGKKNGYGLVECGECGLRFADPMPSAADLDALYSEYASNPSYSSKAAKKVARTSRRLKRYMHMAPGNNFLDLGCNVGTGVEAARLLGLDAHGIDVGEESIMLARELFPLGKYHAGPIEDIPAEWGAFDFVYTSEVIEHLPELRNYFTSLAARMKPGALIYITTPDASHWRVPADFASWDEVRPPEHIHFFNRKSLTRLLAQHGLDIVKFEWAMKPGLKALARKR